MSSGGFFFPLLSLPLLFLFSVMCARGKGNKSRRNYLLADRLEPFSVRKRTYICFDFIGEAAGRRYGCC